MIQNLKGGNTAEGKAKLAKMNKALGFKTDKRTRKKGHAGDKRVKHVPRSRGGDMGLTDQIIDAETGGLSEFGAKLRNTAPSVRAAMEKLKMANKPKELDDPTIQGKSMAHRFSDDESDLSDDSAYGDDDALAIIRRKRITELKVKSALNDEWLKRGHGKYQEIVEEEFLTEVTKSKHVVCHFYHKDFERCKIMDKHLAILARKHLCAHFIYLNAEKCPFFVKKLQIRVLPTVVLFQDGIAKDRVTGFEELGGKDDFETIVLEKRIAESGCIPKPPEPKKTILYGGIRSRKQDEDDDDFDW